MVASHPMLLPLLLWLRTIAAHARGKLRAKSTRACSTERTDFSYNLLLPGRFCMQLMRMTEDGPLQPTPLWLRADLEGPALVREFLRESRIVRKGLDGSLAKARNIRPCI